MEDDPPAPEALELTVVLPTVVVKVVDPEVTVLRIGDVVTALAEPLPPLPDAAP